MADTDQPGRVRHNSTADSETQGVVLEGGVDALTSGCGWKRMVAVGVVLSSAGALVSAAPSKTSKTSETAKTSKTTESSKSKVAASEKTAKSSDSTKSSKSTASKSTKAPAASKKVTVSSKSKKSAESTAPKKTVASVAEPKSIAPAKVDAPTAPPAPAPPGLNIRIIGTASFQGKQTALVEDMNTRSDSFYTVGDPIYGYKITAISADGLSLEKNAQKHFVTFEPTTVRAGMADSRSQVVVANTYLPSEGGLGSSMPNFYTDFGSALSGKTQWDSGTSRMAKAGKLPAMAGDAIAAIASGLFNMPLANYKRMSSGFGYRKHPIGGGTKMHKGLDFAANRGTRILASNSGTVKWSGWKGGYGYCIVIDHHNGYETLYGHCSKLIADVGDNVRNNDLIAEVGSTGASTGNHLHFEVHKGGVPVDPEPYLAKFL